MEYTLREDFSPQERAAVAARVLAALPEWFGIPESTAQYVEDCKTLPFVAVCHGETPVGFLALRQTAPQAGHAARLSPQGRGPGAAGLGGAVRPGRRVEAAPGEDGGRLPPQPGVRPHPGLLPRHGLCGFGVLPHFVGCGQPLPGAGEGVVNLFGKF